MTREEALKIRAIIEQAAQSLDDKTASEAVQLCHKLKQNGDLVPVNTRIQWGGGLKRAKVNLWDTVENNPANAPALWEDVFYKDGYRVIPENIPSTDAFSLGECGWWNDVLYESIFNGANVWNPAEYAQAWKEVEQ